MHHSELNTVFGSLATTQLTSGWELTVGTRGDTIDLILLPPCKTRGRVVASFPLTTPSFAMRAAIGALVAEFKQFSAKELRFIHE